MTLNILLKRIYLKNIKITEFFLWLFWAIGGITLSIIIYNLFCSEDFSKFLPAFGILISAFIASLSIMRTINNTNTLETNKKQNDISKYYVEKCTEGFEIVYNLLKNKNNNSSTWVEAARILKYTLDISSNIKDDSHKKIYNIKAFQYRHLLLKELSDKYGKSLPTSFFFGVKDWENLKVNEAEEIAKNNNSSGGWIEEYETTPYPKAAYIGEASIKVIFDFISYDDKFEDPLNNEKIENLEEWKNTGGIFIIKDGAYNYLKFRKDTIKNLKKQYIRTEK